MQIIHLEKNIHILRLVKGEELFKTLKDYCQKKTIQAAWFSVLGAGDYTKISYYDLNRREYLSKEFTQEFEILNVTGNVSYFDKNMVCHAHGTFSKTDYSTFGGHIDSLQISGTGEVRLEIFDTYFDREKDAETGLNVLKGINE